MLYHYNNQVQSDRDKNKPLRIKEHILRLKKYSFDLLRKDIPLLITEWNISSRAKLSNKVYSFIIERIKKEFDESGVTATYFWSLRRK